jgi:putative ABC transport system permease protein
MIAVADVSIARGCGLPLKRLAGALFLALLIGTVVPLVFFVFVILQVHTTLNAQYVIPISGMILGNCLRADIIGIRTFCESLKRAKRSTISPWPRVPA